MQRSLIEIVAGKLGYDLRQGPYTIGIGNIGYSQDILCAETLSGEEAYSLFN